MITQDCAAILEDTWVVPSTTKRILTIWFLGHAPWYLSKEVENMSTQKPAQKLIAALFIITQTQKQPSCPSVGEWISKLIYTGNVVLLNAKYN